MDYYSAYPPFFNCSSVKFSAAELQSLSLGLKHVFHPVDNVRREIVESLHRFIRAVGLKFIYRLKIDDFPFLPSLHNKSTSFDMPKVSEPIARLLHELERDVYSEMFLVPRQKFFKSHHRINIENLVNSKKLIFTSSDKNLGLCIFDAEHYNSLCLEHLNSDSYLRLEDENINIAIANCAKYLLWFLKEHENSFDGLNPQFYSFLRESLAFDRQAPYFRILPKLHKLPAGFILNNQAKIPTRPIVASTNWLTTNASKVLSEFLQPIVDTLPTILKDSRELIRNVNNLIIPSNSRIFTIDVVNFYGNMDCLDIIRKIKKYNIWANFQDRPTIPDWVCLLIQWILENNIFTFSNRVFKQLVGMAMGTNFAVTIANLYGFCLFELDPEIANVISFLPFYGRYIDDACGIWNRPEIEFLNLVELFNSRTPLIKVTWSLNRRLPFLDLHLSLTPHPNHEESLQVSVSLFQKELNKYLYITAASAHPKSLKRGFIIAELQRFARNSSSLQAFYKCTSQFRFRLLRRGYSNNFINKVFFTVSYSDRDKFINTPPKISENCVPFIIRHSHRIDRMKLGLTLKNLNNRLTTQWLGAPAPRLILSRKTNQSIRSLTSKYHFPRLSLKYAEFEPLITNSATWQPPVKRRHVQVQNPAPINRFQARLEHWQANFLDRHEGLEIDLENPEAEPALPENHVYRQHRNMDLEENIANIFERRLNR